MSQYADLYGEWCESEVALFAELLRPDSNVVEVGAHIGLHTVPLSKIVHQGLVVCFEPQRILFQMLCANCALNSRTNVHGYNCAVSASGGTLEVASTDYAVRWNYGAFSLDRGFDTEGRFPGRTATESITCFRLDEAPMIGRLDAISLLKIDVEGFEAEVLKGAAGVLSRHRPMIFIENNKEEKGDLLIALLREYGYRCYWYCVQRFRPDNFNEVGWKVPGTDVNMLCLPAERASSTFGLMEVNDFSDLKKGLVQAVHR